MVMNLEEHTKPNIRTPMGTDTKQTQKSKKCYEAFRRVLQADRKEKLMNCNQCNYASSHADSLKNHLKMHSGEKSNKCKQCDYASSQASNMKTHLKIHSGEKKQTNAINVTLHLHRQAI